VRIELVISHLNVKVSNANWIQLKIELVISPLTFQKKNHVMNNLKKT